MLRIITTHEKSGAAPCRHRLYPDWIATLLRRYKEAAATGIIPPVMSVTNPPPKNPSPSPSKEARRPEHGERQQKPQGQRPQQRPERAQSAPPAPPVRNPLPEITFPEELPVSGRRQEIAAALQANQVIIVSGETGSGKTTQLPKICLQLGRGEKGLIGHTQPRRIAASSTAKRIAQELGTPPGEHVGFKVRFNDTLSKGAWVKLMTDGILLAETQTDPLLRQYDTIIIDEAHERSLNIDFLLGYLKQLLPKRPDLKIIITSATIDANRFAQHFAVNQIPAPVIEVSGRLFPVEQRYLPLEGAGKKEAKDLSEGVAEAINDLWREGALGA